MPRHGRITVNQEGVRQASVKTDSVEGSRGGPPVAPAALCRERSGRAKPRAAARGPGLGYCGVLVAGSAVGIAAAGTGAAGIGVAPEREWVVVAWAYLVRSSRISDW